MTAEHLRVLLVSANYRPSVGGIERFVEVLAEELARRGHRVAVACCREGDAPLRESLRGVEVTRLRASNLPRRLAGVPYPLPAPWELLRALPRLVGQADVVHVQDAVYATSVAALASAARRAVPSVLTQHVGHVPQASRVLDGAQALATRAVGRVARRASAVATYNDSVADWAASTWGVARPRLLPSGVEVPTASPAERAAARRELGLSDEAFVALFVGRDVPKKHLDAFLAAARPGAFELVAVTDRTGPAPPGARLVPFRPPERFAVLLASCDAFVLPSEGEGFPLALQEALLAGLPCVIVRHPGYERYVGDEDVVYVDRDGAAIRAALEGLVASPERRAALAARAAEAGRRSFGVAAFTDAYEALYRELVSQA